MSTLPTVLEDAWNAAGPKLQQIGATLADVVSHSPRFFRVTQLDAELLDQELLQLLLEPIHRVFSLVDSTIKTHFEPEIRLLLQLILYKLSIWNTGASYGAKLQNMGYVAPQDTQSTVFAPSGLPQHTLIRHASLTLILPYLHDRIRSYAISHSWPDAPSSDKRRKLWRLLNILESVCEALCLVNFIAFLRGGRYRTLTDRFLKLSLVPSLETRKREISYEFMNRQMVWQAFTEFLLFLLPLISRRAIRRITSQGLSVVSEALRHSLPAGLTEKFFQPGDITPRKRGKYVNLPPDQCAICFENSAPKVDISELSYGFGPTPQPSSPKSESLEASNEPLPYPIHNPYLSSCGHIYCYQCIAGRMLQAADETDNIPWECLRCGEFVKEAHRYQIGIHDREFSESEYEFSSDFDLSTDLSGSMYSESGLSE